MKALHARPGLPPVPRYARDFVPGISLGVAAWPDHADKAILPSGFRVGKSVDRFDVFVGVVRACWLKV